MKLHAIVALTKDRVIGKNNQLPWHLPSDLKRFKKLTMGHPIVMGRKTFESIGRVLPGRPNLVLTRNSDYTAEGVTVFTNLEDIFNYCEKELAAEKVFIIGGAEIIKIALPKIEILNLTWIEKHYEGDVFLPELELEDFKVVNEERFDSPFPHSFCDYERISQASNS